MRKFSSSRSCDISSEKIVNTIVLNCNMLEVLCERSPEFTGIKPMWSIHICCKYCTLQLAISTLTYPLQAGKWGGGTFLKTSVYWRGEDKKSEFSTVSVVLNLNRIHNYWAHCTNVSLYENNRYFFIQDDFFNINTYIFRKHKKVWK